MATLLPVVPRLLRTRPDDPQGLVANLLSEIWDALEEAGRELEQSIVLPLLRADGLQAAYNHLRPGARQGFIRIGEILDEATRSDLQTRGLLAAVFEQFQIDPVGDQPDETDFIKGQVRLASLQFNDYLTLLSLGVDVPLELEDSLAQLTEAAVDVSLCLLPIMHFLTQEPDERLPGEEANAKTLIRWARKYSSTYLRLSGDLLDRLLLAPANVGLRQEYYTRKLDAFIGKGPKGILKALLDERRQDAERE